jgi:hypothetical protein
MSARTGAMVESAAEPAAGEPEFDDEAAELFAASGKSDLAEAAASNAGETLLSCG